MLVQAALSMYVALGMQAMMLKWAAQVFPLFPSELSG